MRERKKEKKKRNRRISNIWKQRNYFFLTKRGDTCFIIGCIIYREATPPDKMTIGADFPVTGDLSLPLLSRDPARSMYRHARGNAIPRGEGRPSWRARSGFTWMRLLVSLVLNAAFACSTATLEQLPGSSGRLINAVIKMLDTRVD